MSRQVNRSVAAFLTGLLLAALTATAAATPNAERGQGAEKSSESTSTATFKSPASTDPHLRKAR
jgi:ABC-type oligopeptide transport system substrate-binding subunit